MRLILSYQYHEGKEYDIKLRKRFYKSIEVYGVAKEDLQKYRAVLKCTNIDKYKSNQSILNVIRYYGRFQKLYGNLVEKQIEWHEEGNMKIPICACGTRITDLSYWIYNHTDARAGKKIKMFRIGSSCITRFIGKARTCLICGKRYNADKEHCSECKEEHDKKKEEEHQKYLSTRCTDCEVKVIDRTKFERCYTCYMKYKPTQNCCIDCRRVCKPPFVRCYNCNLKYKI
jgi:hypothetical protein